LLAHFVLESVLNLLVAPLQIFQLMVNNSNYLRMIINQEEADVVEEDSTTLVIEMLTRSHQTSNRIICKTINNKIGTMRHPTFHKTSFL